MVDALNETTADDGEQNRKDSDGSRNVHPVAGASKKPFRCHIDRQIAQRLRSNLCDCELRGLRQSVTAGLEVSHGGQRGQRPDDGSNRR